MTLTEKWIKDRRTQLKNEIKTLQLRVKHMHSAIQQTEHEIMIKQGEIKAINEVAAEMQRPAQDFHIKKDTPILSKKEKLQEKVRLKMEKKGEKRIKTTSRQETGKVDGLGKNSKKETTGIN